MTMFKKVAIIGVGLIGGSVGQAAKKRKIATKIVGICRRESSRRKALKFKAVDEATLNLKKGIEDADLVIIASPVGKISLLVKKAVKFMKKGAILTDVGSSKSVIVREADKASGKKINFVGSHPMAGSDKSGVWNASSNLFEGATLVLTKTKKTNKNAIKRLEKFWKKLGCKVIILSPEKHDAFASLASYLPHIVSFALSSSQTNNSIKLAAGSLKSTTRVASSDADLWKDIFLSARKPLLDSIGTFFRNLKSIEKTIRKNDEKKLKNILNKARKIRKKIEL